MIILTLKERQLIDNAVFNLGTSREISIWREWKLAHQTVRSGPSDPVDDGLGDMPRNFQRSMTAALRRSAKALSTKIHSAELSDDDATDLCNDLVEIGSTIEVIQAAIPRAIKPRMQPS